MSQIRLLAFSGSARRESFNQRLVRLAAHGARSAGAEVTDLDLRDLPMPLFDQDLEAENGLPENARRFKRLLAEHHGFLLACPEYNGSITPLLKNAVDWASRKEKDEAPLAAYRGKVAALMSASPGRLGGLRGLVHVRSILHGIGVLVLPDQVAVGGAAGAFGDDGRLADAALQGRVEALGRQLTEMAAKLAA